MRASALTFALHARAELTPRQAVDLVRPVLVLAHEVIARDPGDQRPARTSARRSRLYASVMHSASQFGPPSLYCHLVPGSKSSGM
jgi:hypothetical protein